MKHMHSLLRRQIKKYFGGTEGIPDGLETFIQSIDRTYREFDTDREMLERSLELSSREMLQANAELRAVFQAFPDLIFRLEADGTIISCEVGRDIDLFSAPEKVIGRHIYDIPVPEVGMRFRRAISKVKETQTIVCVEYDLNLNGRTNFYEARLIPYLENQMVVIIRNVTDQKQVQEALRKSEEHFRMLLQSVPIGISVMDQDLIFQYFNLRFTEIFGYTLRDIHDKNTWFKKAYPDPAYRKKVISVWTDDLIKNVKNETVYDRIFTVRCKNGKDKLISFRSIVTPDGKHMVTYEDITERKRLEDQLIHAQKMEAIGTLAGGIAHDFNNLLMGIQGRTSLMLMDIGPSHPHFTYLNHIEDIVKSGANLTKQLLGFARRGKYDEKLTNLNELIQKSMEMFVRTRKEIKVVQKFKKDLWMVEVDQGQIEQVLLNMYVNAWHAMPGGGTLYLTTENIVISKEDEKLQSLKPGEYVLVSITDTGVGMDKETSSRIFEPFFTTKEIGSGTGLGLASAYGIILNHNGVINVYSEQGVGTTFKIYLPASVKKTEQTEELSEGIAMGTETVLLVDDEDIVVEVGRKILERFGYKVLTARNGVEAIEVFKSHSNIDIVILDMIMPEMGGGETYDRLKEIRPDIKVILASGYSVEGRAQEILKRGCNCFVQKPFDINDISQKIREVLSSG